MSYAPKVSATSIYDDAVRITSTLKQGRVDTSSNDEICPVNDISTNWTELITSSGNVDAVNSFHEALAHGSWYVSQVYSHDAGHLDYNILVTWHVSAQLNIDWKDGSYISTPYERGSSEHFMMASIGDGAHTNPCDLVKNFGTGSLMSISASQSIAPDIAGYPNGLKLFSMNSSGITYPSGYEGIVVPNSAATTDYDDDGLTTAQEQSQNTSDAKKDSDGDGLNDLVESQWYPDYDEVFCDTSTPKNCADPNPTKKDIYVEIDWMYDASSSRLLKPTSTQLGILTALYNDHDILFHADTGQYGGGEVLLSYIHTLKLAPDPLIPDASDLKASNFSTARENIWRYMIYGYEFSDTPGSSGSAEASGDDIFISGGLVEDNQNTVSKDRAVAGTMAHEIGHTLCLSPALAYIEQPVECIYGGIDNKTNKPANYESVMNYRYQLTDEDDMGRVDYSDGSHGVGDHNDWSAISVGMGHFGGTKTYLGARVATSNKTFDPASTIHEAPMENYDVEERKFKPKVTHNQSNTIEKDKNTSTETSQQDRNGSQEPSKNGTAQEWTLYMIGGVAVVATGGIVWGVHRRLHKGSTRRN